MPGYSHLTRLERDRIAELKAQELSGFLKAEGVVYGEDSDFAPAHYFALSAEVRGDFALSDAWNFSFQAFGRYDPESSEQRLCRSACCQVKLYQREF